MEKLHRQRLGKKKLALMWHAVNYVVQSRIVPLLTLLGNQGTIRGCTGVLPTSTTSQLPKFFDY